MLVVIRTNAVSYLPEAMAYENYLSAHGHQAYCTHSNETVNGADIEIQFMGIHSRFQKKRSTPVIHEYHSLSTPPLARIKNFAKRLLNTTPRGRIFLNQFIQNEMGFHDSIPYIHRDMGVDDLFFHVQSQKPEFDLVYSGSLGRAGLAEQIHELQKRNFSLLLIGEMPPIMHAQLRSLKGVEITGRVRHEEVPALLARARAGLSYTPDVYPYSLQTSTKTLEYLAAGLPVVTNKTSWARTFSQNHATSFMWLDELQQPEQLAQLSSPDVDLSAFRWGTILERAGFIPFLTKCAE